MTAVATSSSTTPTYQPGPSWGGGRIALIVVGSLLALLGVSILIGGVAVAVVDNTRDRDGFLMSAPGELSSGGYAVTVSALQVSSFGGWAIDAQSTAGTTRITATGSDRPVFIGIGPSDKVAAYLAGVKHDVLEDISTTPFRATYVPVAGGAPSSRPAAQTFWTATSTGTDNQQVLTWPTQAGDWSVVMMNADGSDRVNASVSVGATVPILHSVAVGLSIGGAVLFLLGLGLIIGAVVSYGRQPRVTQQPRITVSQPQS
jgi:hypothetical protein